MNVQATYLLTGLLSKLLSIVFADEQTLRHVSVIFRHGDRTPDIDPFRFPNDPFMNSSYFPEGSVVIAIQEGKRRMYDLGRFLRKRYNEFLGPDYQKEVLSAISSDFYRTKMSLQLVLAGLYPPMTRHQRWRSDLNWQPIPTTYLHFIQDKLFHSRQCPSFVEEYQRVLNLPEVLEKLNEFIPTENSLAMMLGREPPMPNIEIRVFDHNLRIERGMNLTLPLWMSDLLSNELYVKGIQYRYELSSYNDKLKRVNGGMLLRKISDGMIEIKNGSYRGPRVYLYSGHDTNIIGFQNALGVFKPHFPHFSSAVIVELLAQNERYYAKVLYYLGIPQTIEELTIPGCATLCPFEQFLDVLEKVIPSNVEMTCVKSIPDYFFKGN